MGDYNAIAEVFTSATEHYDEKISKNFINLLIRDIEVSVLSKYVKGEHRVLEIGCGTGQEALRLLRSSKVCIDCIDISNGMLKFATDKIKRAGIADRFNAIRLDAADLSGLRQKYDLIYSFNGALNTEPRIGQFSMKLLDVLKEGGYFIFSVRNRYCVSDFIYSTFRGKGNRIKLRLRGYVDVPVGDATVYSRYYSYNEINSMFRDSMELIEVVGLGNIIFPYIGEFFADYKLNSFISNVEMLTSRIFPLNLLGDEILYVYRRK